MKAAVPFKAVPPLFQIGRYHPSSRARFHFANNIFNEPVRLNTLNTHNALNLSYPPHLCLSLSPGEIELSIEKTSSNA